MNVRGFYPLVVTSRLKECEDFWTQWFGFHRVFGASWFVLLEAPGEKGFQIGYLHPDHPSQPPGPELYAGEGMTLEIEVADVDVLAATLAERGFPVEYALREEPWGERRFGFHDPAGVWVDVLERVAPLPGWWDQYMQDPG